MATKQVKKAYLIAMSSVRKGVTFLTAGLGAGATFRSSRDVSKVPEVGHPEKTRLSPECRKYSAQPPLQ